MRRQASAKWKGKIEDGRGSFSTESGSIQDEPFSFATRFSNERGTNPEELIGSAHAGCFSMALAGILAKAGFNPQLIETKAIVTLDNKNGNWSITSSHLEVEASVDGIETNRFQDLAEEAKSNCPVSRLLNAEISVEARLRNRSQSKGKERTEASPPPH